MSNTRTTKKTAKSLRDKLAGAQRLQESLTIYLPGPLRTQWEQANAELVDAKQAAVAMLNGDPKVKRLANKVVALEKQMSDDAVVVTAQALRRKRTANTPQDELTWPELRDQHPPRKGKDGKVLPEDAPGVNMATFPEPLIRASIIDPNMDDEEWDLLNEVMNDAQFDQLFGMCWRLNRNPVDLPFSFAASRTLKSASASRRQNDSASHSDGSTAGNPEA